MIRVLANDGIEAKAKDELERLGIEVIDTHYDEKTLKDEIKNFNVILVRSATKIRENIIDRALENKKLKLIIRCGVGIDNIDVKYAKEKGIDVVNTPCASSVSVAEMVLAHMFSLARFLNQSNITMREDKWNKKEYLGVEILGKTLGILGMGRIGKELALRGKALGMNIIYYDILGEVDELYGDFKDFDYVLKNSNFLSINVSGDKIIIGKDELRKMRKDSFLINCSRGKTVDEEALIEALNHKQILGAGLDVFSSEPIKNKELLNCKNLSLSPHVGASTKEAQEKIGEEIISIIKSKFNL
ncbi:MAG: D-2-hydroxyacid dehydrogenase [Clostridium perfringens]|nr:D-2-hydroxyacid dehydrogenase [Clostridium perfringens]